MGRKFNNIISFLLLLVFLIPSIVKPIHHHEHGHLKINKGIHLSQIQDKCAICSLEFSLFSNDTQDFGIKKESTESAYCNNYESIFYLDPSQFLCSLRAPPKMVF